MLVMKNECWSVKEFYWQRLLAAGVREPDGFHSEFVKGAHGQKLDMEKVLSRRRSPDYLLGLVLKGGLVADEVRRMGGRRVALVGIANGMTTHAHDLSRYMSWRHPGLEVTALDTEKIVEGKQKTIQLTGLSRHILERRRFDVAVLDDDVGTRGSSTAQPVPDLRDYGIPHIFAAYNVLRSGTLPDLDALGVPTLTLLSKPQPNYSPEDCAQVGFCAMGWDLAEYGTEAQNVV